MTAKTANQHLLAQQIQEMAAKAKKASYQLAALSCEQKNTILHQMKLALAAAEDRILSANAKDLEAGKQSGLSNALLDRLALSSSKMAAIMHGFETVIELPDPLHKILTEFEKSNGLFISKVSVPIGVIGIIYESRPNVTADVAALCLKAGNATILRGGKEAMHSNRAIAKALIEGGLAAGMPLGAIQLIDTTDHEAVRYLAQLNRYIDLIIPRGGERLIEAVTSVATVPVIKHYKGLCHVYVDASANLDMATNIVINAKCQRPGVCNAIETLLVHRDIAASFLPALCQTLRELQVELRGDEHACAIVSEMKTADVQDWDTEYLDLILAIKVVDSASEAIAHINQHGSHHSDAIVAEDVTAQQQFIQEVDSAATYVNASTRFTDGAEFGMGAEIGISTDKLHARGPMGLTELTTYKYVIRGQGQVRE